MKRIAAFDFDGTITQKDTLFEFLRFTHGWRCYLFILILSPVLVVFKLGFITNEKAKRVLFSFFYKGWRIDRFDQCCLCFVDSIKVRPQAWEAIEQHSKRGDDVVVISASFENWVYPWAAGRNIERVLATRIEVVDGLITGNFQGRNCYGPEKVHRLTELFPVRSDYYLTAYGDSRGDRELLAFSDEGYFRKF